MVKRNLDASLIEHMSRLHCLFNRLSCYEAPRDSASQPIANYKVPHFLILCEIQQCILEYHKSCSSSCLTSLFALVECNTALYHNHSIETFVRKIRYHRPNYSREYVGCV